VAWEAGHNKLRVAQYTPGQYHIPLVPFLGGFEPDVYERLCELQFAAGVALALGVLPRLAAIAAFVFQGALFSVSLLNFRNHIYLTLVLLALAPFAPLHRGWGVQWALRRAVRWLRHQPPPDDDGTTGATAWRMIQVTTVSVYFWATFHKAIAGFHSGFALSRELPRYVRGGPLPKWLQEHRPAMWEWLWAAVQDEASMKWLSWATLVVEAAIAIGFVFRRTRWLAALLGIALHVGIAAFANIYSFGTLLIGTYLLFLYDRPVVRAPLSDSVVPDASVAVRTDADGARSVPSDTFSAAVPGDSASPNERTRSRRGKKGKPSRSASARPARSTESS
jgi:hypothetical protein